MRLIIFILTILFAVSCTSSTKTSRQTAAEAKAAAAPEFKLRNFTTQTLPNGMTVIWIPDTTLPYVSMQLMIKAGSSSDPAGKEGLASFTASMLEKGTAKKSAVQVSDALSQYGTTFSASADADSSRLGISSLSFYKDQALDQFLEILMTPAFSAAEIERERKLTLAGLTTMADDPQGFSRYLFTQFLYGNHPYGHDSVGNFKSVPTLTKADLQKFYSENYAPNNAVLAVVGQIDDAFKAKITSGFGKWTNRSSRVSAVPEFPKWDGTESLVVDRADLNQAQIHIGFKGIPRNIPEFLELRAAQRILGGGFGSRLFSEVRERRGLTYSIYLWMEARSQAGPMSISTFTRLEKFDETIQESIKVYRDFVKQGVTDQEVEDARQELRGQFPRLVETPEALATQLLVLARYGVSPDYLTGFYANLEKLNKTSINTTIRKYFDPQNLRIVVYAPRTKTEESLKKMGRVEVKNYKEFLR